MTRSANLIFRVFLLSLLICVAPALAQNTQKPASPNPATDATWTKKFAVSFNPQQAAGEQGQKNIIIDPRFEPLLKASFPQRQWFWHEHGRLVSMDSLIYSSIATGGDVLLDEGRYVTIDGCYVGICDVVRGMLWIDTGIKPANMIFVSTQLVSGDGPERYQLWIFSSRKLDWQHLPPAFSTSLPRWLCNIETPGYNAGNGYNLRFVLANIVQPNGVIEDISPETLHIRTLVIGTTKTGAKQ
jgi:hypothetical protein